MESGVCTLSPPPSCVYNPSAGQTMWSDTWILILPLPSFVSTWHGNQYFSQGEWTESHISSIYLHRDEEHKLNDFQILGFRLLSLLFCLLISKDTEDTDSRFLWLFMHELTCSMCPKASEKWELLRISSNFPGLDRSVCWSPKSWWFMRNPHRTQHVVVLTVMTCYSERVQS